MELGVLIMGKSRDETSPSSSVDGDKEPEQVKTAADILIGGHTRAATLDMPRNN